jgi:hypothetical protein
MKSWSKIYSNIPMPSFIEWLCLAFGLCFVYRYFWIFDDAFVYFRYIDNLLILNLGLVYNHGEFVEGFSSPFYLILLILFRLMNCSYLLAYYIIGFLSFTVFWLMLVILNRRLSPPSAPVINFPLVYLSFNYAVLSFFSSGVETPLVQVAAVAYALYILKPRSTILQIILASSPMIRHELIIPFGLCSLWAWFHHKYLPKKMLAMAFIFLASWIAFRIYYYADLFPVTFYLKDILWFEQGFKYIHNTFATYHLYSVFGLFLIFILLLKKKGIPLDSAKRLMILCGAAPIVLYVAKIGGDFRHYRYLAFPFCLSVCAFGGILEHLCQAWCPPRFIRLIPVLGIAVAMIVFSFYPPQLDRHPMSADVKHEMENGIIDSAMMRSGDTMERQIKIMTFTHERMLKYREENPVFEYKDTIASYNCGVNYMKFHIRCINIYGLTDGILARVEMSSDRPAHKHGLFPLAHHMVSIQKTAETIGPGMYRKLVGENGRPYWISSNFETIDEIEQKIYNEHDFIENLKSAFSFPRKIIPYKDPPQND